MKVFFLGPELEIALTEKGKQHNQHQTNKTKKRDGTQPTPLSTDSETTEEEESQNLSQE